MAPLKIFGIHCTFRNMKIWWGCWESTHHFSWQISTFSKLSVNSYTYKLYWISSLLLICRLLVGWTQKKKSREKIPFTGWSLTLNFWHKNKNYTFLTENEGVCYLFLLKNWTRSCKEFHFSRNLWNWKKLHGEQQNCLL